MRRLLPMLAVLLLAAPAAARADQPAGSETATGGPVTATLAWQAGEFGATDPALTITRGGAAVLTGPLDPAGTADDDKLCNGCVFLGAQDSSDVEVADLQNDGEPEVLVSGFTGGAHCCTVTGIYFFDPATSTYKRVVRNWGDGGYVLIKSGTAFDFRTDDDAFAYRFASYASSLRPPLVLRFAAGKFTDVTGQHLALVRTHAKEALEIIRKTSPKDELPNENRGPMAAYVADEYLLGHGSTGLKELDKQAKRGSLGTRKGAKRFRADLLKFLKAGGYR